MILLLKPQISFTYDCRRCEKPVFGTADLFPMHSARYVCRCDCRESALVAFAESGRLVVEFPCSICGKRHRDSLPLDEVLNGGPSALRCAVTDLAACYVGTRESLEHIAAGGDVAAALDGFLNGLPPEGSALPPSASDALGAVRHLAEEERLSCRCGSLRFTAAYDNGTLSICCASCGSSRSFAACTACDIAAFLAQDHIIL